MADPSTSLHLLEVCCQACLSFVLLQMREQRDKLLRLGAVDDLVFLDLGPKFGVVHLDTHGNGAMRLAGCGGFLLRNELCFRNLKKKKIQSGRLLRTTLVSFWNPPDPPPAPEGVRLGLPPCESALRILGINKRKIKNNVKPVFGGDCACCSWLAAEAATEAAVVLSFGGCDGAEPLSLGTATPFSFCGGWAAAAAAAAGAALDALGLGGTLPSDAKRAVFSARWRSCSSRRSALVISLLLFLPSCCSSLLGTPFCCRLSGQWIDKHTYKNTTEEDDEEEGAGAAGATGAATGLGAEAGTAGEDAGEDAVDPGLALTSAASTVAALAAVALAAVAAAAAAAVVVVVLAEVLAVVGGCESSCAMKNPCVRRIGTPSARTAPFAATAPLPPCCFLRSWLRSSMFSTRWGPWGYIPDGRDNGE